METRANYALIGAFTLAALAAAFMFVFWFSGGSKSAQRKTYEIVFTGSVSGLTRGSSVLFNGLRVGEVTAIDLMEADPSRVAATVQVSQRTPVKEDTSARLEFQGLTGVASIAFAGGSAMSPEVPPKEVDPAKAQIFADRSDFQSLMENLQGLSVKGDAILARIDGLLKETSPSATAILRNVERFSSALAANSAGMDAFLAGMSELGRKIGPLASKLEGLAETIDQRLKPIDPQAFATIAADVAAFTRVLRENEAPTRILLTEGAQAAANLSLATTKANAFLDLANGALTAFEPARLGAIVRNAEGFAKVLDDNRAHVDSALRNAADMMGKLDQAAGQISGLMASLEKFLGSPESGGMFSEIAETARSIRKLSDNLDLRSREITAGIARFTGPVAREYEALAVEGRKTVNELNRAVRSIERNPQQFLLGPKPALPEYRSAR